MNQSIKLIGKPIREVPRKGPREHESGSEAKTNRHQPNKGKTLLSSAVVILRLPQEGISIRTFQGSESFSIPNPNMLPPACYIRNEVLGETARVSTAFIRQYVVNLSSLNTIRTSDI